jgi:hypothetical protein
MSARWLYWLGGIVLVLLIGPLLLDRGGMMFRQLESRIIHDDHLQHNARVSISSPAVYSRERLLNDRFEQVAWLDSLLRNSERESFQPQATSPPQAPAGSTTQPARPASLGRDRGLEQSWTPRDGFEFINSYRDVLRAERAREMLDDGHDMDAGTLHLLSFDVTVAAREGAHGFAAAEVVLTRDPETFTPGLRRGTPGYAEAVARVPGLEAAIRRMEDLRLQDALDLYVLWMRRVRENLSSGVRNIQVSLQGIVDQAQAPEVPGLLRGLEVEVCTQLTLRLLRTDVAVAQAQAAVRPFCEAKLATRGTGLLATSEAPRSVLEAYDEHLHFLQGAQNAFADHLATLRIRQNARAVTMLLGDWRGRGLQDGDRQIVADGVEIFRDSAGCVGGKALVSEPWLQTIGALKTRIDLGGLLAEANSPAADPRLLALNFFFENILDKTVSCTPLHPQVLTPMRRAQLSLAVFDSTAVSWGAPDIQIPSAFRYPADSSQENSTQIVVHIRNALDETWLSCLASRYLLGIYEESKIGNQNHYGGRVTDFFLLQLEVAADGRCALTVLPRIRSMLPVSVPIPDVPPSNASDGRSRSERPSTSPSTAPSCTTLQKRTSFEATKIQANEVVLDVNRADFRCSFAFQDNGSSLPISTEAPIMVRLERKDHRDELVIATRAHGLGTASEGTASQSTEYRLQVDWRGPGTLASFCRPGCSVRRDVEASLLLHLSTLLEGPGYSERGAQTMLRAATYSLTPRLRQAVSRQDRNLSNVLLNLLGTETAISDNSQSSRSGVEPEVVGFTRTLDEERSRVARFGWMVMPPPNVAGSGVWRAATQQAQLGAIVAMPSWWRTALIKICRGFTGGPSAALLSDDFWRRHSISCHVEIVRLPGTATDVSRRIGVEVITYPFLYPPVQSLGDSPTSTVIISGTNLTPEVTVGRPGRILLRGERLWRSAVVTLDAQRAEQIEVLPDMSGIVARFNCVLLPTGLGSPWLPQQQEPKVTLPRWIRDDQPPAPPPSQTAQLLASNTTSVPATPNGENSGSVAGAAQGARRPAKPVAPPPPPAQAPALRHNVRLTVWTSEGSAQMDARVNVPYAPSERSCPDRPPSSGTSPIPIAAKAPPTGAPPP